MKLLRIITAHIVLAGALLFPAFVLVPVASASAPYTVASAASDACEGIALTGGACSKDGTGSQAQISNVVKTIINVLSAIVGVAAVVMIIVSGFKYITSNGDASNITSAKHTIIYAIVGLVIVALAQVIVRFVLEKVG